MFRRKKPMWAPQLDALPSDEKGQAISAIYALKVAGKHMRKLKVSPVKGSLEFEALVARVAGASIRPADDPDGARRMFDTAHCLRDGRTVIGGTPVSHGPYGDLLFRVMVGYGNVMDYYYAMRMGYAPQIDPANTVPSPTLRTFLSKMANRYADALTESASGTWRESNLQSVLEKLASQDETPPLVEALRDEPPFRSRVYPPGWGLDYADVLDMTRDDELARMVTSLQPR